MSHGSFFPVIVPDAFRSEALSAYPALVGESREADLLRRMFSYLVYGAPRWSREAGCYELLYSWNLHRDLTGLRAKHEGNGALDWIKWFRQRVFPVRVTPYRREDGQARAVRPKLPDWLRESAERAAIDAAGCGGPMVELISGARVATRLIRLRWAEYEARLVELAGQPSPSHPAACLIQFLNEQCYRTLDRLVKRNLDDVIRAAQAMPMDTAHAINARDATFRVLRVISATRTMVYRESPRTHRIHPVGVTLHQLPRNIRKLALKGGITLDLNAAQLAIVATLWGCPLLQRFLEGPENFWTMMLGFLGVDESYKPVLKEAVYAILFGMPSHGVMRILTWGSECGLRISREAAIRFFGHPLLVEMLERRQVETARVIDAGGAEDAFGEWIELCSSDSGGGTRAVPEQELARKVLARQAQSYEMRIMLSLLPVLQAEKDIRVMSWLHDGITVKILDTSEQERKIKRLKAAVDRGAKSLNINTQLQREGAP